MQEKQIKLYIRDAITLPIPQLSKWKKGQKTKEEKKF